MWKEKFAFNLRLLRQSKKLTQKQLGLILNKKESTIRMWELGKNEPSMTNLIELAEMFEISLDKLVGRLSDD